MPRSYKVFKKRVGRGKESKCASKSDLPSSNEIMADLSSPSRLGPRLG
jgi:hypothetical protein